MLRTISDWLLRIATGQVALVATVVFLLFTAVVLPAQAVATGEYAGEAGSPDTSFWYSAADLYAMAEAYGEAGRAQYVRARFTFDLVWPPVFTVFLAMSLSWLARRLLAPESAWRRANLIPLLAMTADYGENVSAALVIGRYPARTPVAETLAPVFTATKWTALAVAFALLIVWLATALVLRYRAKAGFRTARGA